MYDTLLVIALKEGAVSDGLPTWQSVMRRPVPLPDYVHHLLETAIISGNLQPGQRVSENELAEAFKVSRTPVREAVRILEGQGLIVRRQNKGTFVAARTTPQEARALYEFRVPLESFLTQMATEHITSDEIATLTQLQSQFRTALTHDDAVQARRLIDLDAEFHLLIYRSSHSELFSVVDSYWGRLRRELSGRAYQGDSPVKFSAQHDDIISALQSRDAEQAGRLMASHVLASWRAVATSFTADATEEVVPTSLWT
jgi:DNA-binding GntR family transcriptional regulator